MDKSLKYLYTQRNPKTYTEVSALFESNYQKNLLLIPTLNEITHNNVIRHNKKQDLYLFIEDKTSYTTTFVLTHKLVSVNRPDIRFKVYFDAKLLEVLSVCNKTMLNNARPYLAQCSDINIQLELNTFIEKWIEYCLDKYKGFIWQIT